MNTHDLKSVLALVLVFSLALGVWMPQSARHNRAPVNQGSSATTATAVNTIAEYRATDTGVSNITYAATVTARNANALEARFMLEQQIASLTRYARNQGGRLSLGETRYSRVEKTADTPGLNRNYDFVIVQSIHIDLPAEINQSRTRAWLARLAMNGIRIAIPD